MKRQLLLLQLFATSMLWKVVVKEKEKNVPYQQCEQFPARQKKMPPQGWSLVLMRSLNEWLRAEEEEEKQRVKEEEAEEEDTSLASNPET